MALTPIQEVRTIVGDNNLEFQLLPDETYEYLLGPSGSNGNIKRAALAAIPILLFAVARFPTRERTGSIEVWNDWANAYRRALELFLKDPTLNPILGMAMPYAGGIDKWDMMQNDLNDNNVRPSLYKGVSKGVRPWNEKNSTNNESLDGLYGTLPVSVDGVTTEGVDGSSPDETVNDPGSPVVIIP